jgi:hypothetical protein
MDLGEVRVVIARQTAREQPLDPRSTEFIGWQTDAVQDDEIRGNTGWTRIAIRAQHLPHTDQQTGRPVHFMFS